jgi:hypothetical protein
MLTGAIRFVALNTKIAPDSVCLTKHQASSGHATSTTEEVQHPKHGVAQSEGERPAAFQSRVRRCSLQLAQQISSC